MDLLNFQATLKHRLNNNEYEVLKKICANIELFKHPKEKKSKNNQNNIESKGSLYDLFDSEMFDMHYAIYYMDNKDESGIIDTLINTISKRFINESFFYLPQMWYV